MFNVILASKSKVRKEILNNNTVNDVEKVSEKLIGYRYIDEVHEILRGRHVKWVNISKSPENLKGGGIVLNIKFLDNGVHILCSQGNRITQYKFDECLTFQKLTEQEQLNLFPTGQFNFPVGLLDDEEIQYVKDELPDNIVKTIFKSF